MKKVLISFLLWMSFVYQTSACDVCGCSLGGYSLGILPQYQTHFIGLKYSYAGFSAAMLHNSEYFDNEFSEDSYQRYELLGRYYLSEKFQVNFSLPYLNNHMDGSHQTVRSSGLGDPSILLYFNPINSGNNLTKTWRHSLLIGGGLKLPLGDFQKEDNGTLINRNFQLGTGSLDYLLSGNYTIRYNNLGVNLESAYRINSKNKDEYRFGNQFNFNSMLQKVESIRYLPI